MTAATDYPLTQSNISWIDKDGLLLIRLMLFMILGSVSGYSLTSLGIPDFPWFISDWGVLTAIGVEFLLLNAHFRDYDVYYDNFVKALFEMTYSFQYLVVIMYWLLYYTKGLWNIHDLGTYLYTFNMHILPILVLTIESMINSIIYDRKNGFWRQLWMVAAYFPLTYFSKDIVGYLPYTYIDWESNESYYWVAALIGV
jgi:hypothetical protein